MTKARVAKDRPHSLHRTIKTSLKSFIRHPSIFFKVNDLVLRCHHISTDAYLFIRLFCLHQYYHGLPLPSIDQEFVSYSIMALGFRDNRGKQPTQTDLLQELQSFYNNEFQPIFNHQKHDLRGLSFALPYLCITIKTCISTNIKEHFWKRLARFCNVNGGQYYDDHVGVDVDLTDDNYKHQKYLEIGRLKRCILTNKYEEIPDSLKHWFLQHKDHFIPNTFQVSIPYDCQVHPHKYLGFSFYMNSKYEEFNDSIEEQLLSETLTPEEKDTLNQQKIKLFQPLSLRTSCIPKYITIDTATLINLFLEEKGQKANRLQKLKENQHEVWDSLFNMNHKIFKQSKNYVFNYTIMTDGVGVSLLFKHISIKDKKYGCKVKKEDNPEIKNKIPYLEDLSEEQWEILKTQKMVSVDPGKKNLMYMMDDYGNELRYTCMQRDMETLGKRTRRILNNNKNKEGIDKIQSQLTPYCKKTINYNKFKDYICMKHKVDMETRPFYEDKLYRKLMWRRKTYRQRSEDKFLNNIKKKFGDDIVIAIGDWSNKNTIKGLASTMGIGLKRLISKKYDTVLIDEYNTSKKCCVCSNDLNKIKINGETRFRLLGCQHCKKENRRNMGSQEDKNNPMLKRCRLLTRDRNSCLNMLKIIRHMKEQERRRPEAYCRSKSNE